MHFVLFICKLVKGDMGREYVIVLDTVFLEVYSMSYIIKIIIFNIFLILSKKTEQ